MASYTAPLADIRFVLSRLLGIENLASLPGYEAVGGDVVDAVLDETAKIAAHVFAPLNIVGDKIGVKMSGDAVLMPPGFKDAYMAYVEGGWNGLPFPEEWGGQNLPWSLAMPVQEMLQAANLGLALCTLLNQGAVDAVLEHGSEALKEKFLPKLVTGEWTGVMNLTESQAGSDVGAVQCRAEADADHYRIFGQKIYISYGDHDMTENVIHLVLARLPNAPEGTKGLSLFLVPKILVNDDGSLGEKNDVRAVSVEHKLGQHASPTCVMAYGDKRGATAYLVGAENNGIAAMFTMMNNARIGVGIQGLALMERSYQHALDYAKTRIQGRGLRRVAGNPLVAIIEHPDVRRMLLLMKSHIESARALAYSCALSTDIAKRSADEAERARHSARVDLLTPIVKAWLTDLSNEITSTGVQICGGMGYIEETGMAQHMRDARVLAIYEGTNGIQANDLVFRKIARDNGTALNDMLNEIQSTLPVIQKQVGDDFAVMHAALSTSLVHTREAATWIATQAKADASTAAASAASFLRLLGSTVGGYYLVKSALLAQKDLATRSGDVKFLEAKIMTARFFAEHILPQSAGNSSIITKGAAITLAFSNDYF